jgi:uncharacterized SAM-binding protein YcdF (DUF218 family)
MTFVLSKLFWGVAAPGNLLVLLLVAALVWRWRGRRRRGLGMVVLVALALLAITALPAGEWLVAPLEERFPVPALPERVDGIVVLGGAVETRTSRGSEVHLNDSADRVVEAAVLARRYPEAKLLASGGDGNLIPEGGEQEADLTRDLLIALGVAPERILVEDRSRNTIENAIYSRDMAQPKPGEAWLLVTSAWHMPRAVGCFRHAEFDVLPYPVDFRAAAKKDWLFSLSRHLALLDIAAKEWVGLVSYRLLGRIDSVFPAPQAPDAASTRR